MVPDTVEGLLDETKLIKVYFVFEYSKKISYDLLLETLNLKAKGMGNWKLNNIPNFSYGIRNYPYTYNTHAMYTRKSVYDSTDIAH